MIMIVLYVISDVLSGVAGGLYGVEDSDYALFGDVLTVTPYLFGFAIILSIKLYVKDKSRNQTRQTVTS